MGEDRRGGRMMRNDGPDHGQPDQGRSDPAPLGEPPPGMPPLAVPSGRAAARRRIATKGRVRFLVVLVALLAIALLASWLPRLAGSTEAGPSASVILPVVLNAEERALEEELRALAEGFEGETGLAVQDIATGRILHANGNALFPQQSVSKLWVALTALHQVDEGRLDLAETVVLGPQDLTLFHQPLRELVRTRGSFRTDYADLLDRAITGSDNTANDRLLRRVGGPAAVQKFIDEASLTGIRFGTDERSKQSAIAGLQWNQVYSQGRTFYDARDALPADLRRARYEAYLADPIDGASPIGMAHALGQLARGELLSPVSTALLTSTLERTRSGPQRLKGGVPPGWRFGHKTGTGQEYGGEQSGYNDIGILTSPAGREYALVALIRRTGAPVPARMAMMQEVTRAVVRYDEAAYPPPSGEEPVSGAVTTEP